MSAVGWVTLVILAVSTLLAAGAVGAVLICLELTLSQQTSSPHFRGRSGEMSYRLSAEGTGLANPAISSSAFVAARASGRVKRNTAPSPG